MDNKQIVVIKINGVKLPTPSEYTISIEDLDTDESKRAINTGILERSVLRYGMYKIGITYLMKDSPDVATILKMLEPKHLNVELYDWKNQKLAVKQMYCSKKKLGIVKTAKGFMAQGMQFDVTER